MSEVTPIRPVHVHEDFVLSKCDHFVDVQLWPRQVRLDPKGWLKNFLPEEKDHAVHLLNAFLYYSGDIVKEMFRAAFQALSPYLTPLDGPYVQGQAAWQAFRRNVIVTHVTGESPNDTDSGLYFKRLARQELTIPEQNILSPEDTLSLLISRGPRPVLFVDDFVGSGDQFVTTWQRDFTLQSGHSFSFESSSRMRGSSFYYCPLICTAAGRDMIETNCKAVTLCPAHFLTPHYSAVSPDSLIWPEHLRDSAEAFILAASTRAGVPAQIACGYKRLGLCLAFEHSVPDATLPLFYHDQNDWIPLVHRT